MENIILEFISGHEDLKNETISKDEEDKIRKELTKLGYM